MSRVTHTRADTELLSRAPLPLQRMRDEACMAKTAPAHANGYDVPRNDLGWQLLSPYRPSSASTGP